MPMFQDQVKVGDRREWLLRLLFAPNDKGIHCPIYGRTRIMKAAFLVERKLDEVFEIETDFNFTPYKYGPYDKHVFTTLEQLEEEGLITITPEEQHSRRYEGDEYRITDAGIEESRSLYNQLDSGIQDLLNWVKYKQAMRSTGALISYVYMNYPEMTGESELID
jgi:hypothetical protein